MTHSKLTLNIIANCAQGPLLSGGDRIFIELSRRLAKTGVTVNVYVWEEGLAMCRRNHLTGVNIVIWKLGPLAKLGMPLTYILRIVNGLIQAARIKPQNGQSVVYSASDFWPDSLPAFVMHRKLASSKWIAGFYLFAPSPFRGFRQNKNVRLPSLRETIYYLTQIPIFWLIKSYAAKICVTSAPDTKPFLKAGRRKEDLLAVSGGVNLEPVKKYLKNPRRESFIYDACFMGRFHPQKGVVELIKIWSLVCRQKPSAKLALIGEGPLKSKIISEIKRYRLSDNVKLLGYLGDGEQKYRVFRQSRIILHPALYDSGGMSAWEGMVWGRPGIGYDLPALKTYYPQGMLKVEKANQAKFAQAIIALLDNPRLQRTLAQKAQQWAFDEWDWDKKAVKFLSFINS